MCHELSDKAAMTDKLMLVCYDCESSSILCILFVQFEIKLSDFECLLAYRTCLTLTIAVRRNGTKADAPAQRMNHAVVLQSSKCRGRHNVLHHNHWNVEWENICRASDLFPSLWLRAPVSPSRSANSTFWRLALFLRIYIPSNRSWKMSLCHRNALTEHISKEIFHLIAHLESQSRRKKMRDYIFNGKKEIFDFLYNAASERALGLFERVAVVPVEHSLVNKERTGRLEPAPKTKPCPSQCRAQQSSRCCCEPVQSHPARLEQSLLLTLPR